MLLVIPDRGSQRPHLQVTSSTGIDGGAGDLPNLVLLCHRRDWMVHEGRWQMVKQREGGDLTIPPPYRVEIWAGAPGRPWVA